MVDRQALSRRAFLGGIAAAGAAAAVAGFDPVGRRWVHAAEAAEACAGGRFAAVPKIDGTLHTDLATRESVATDHGNIEHHTPEAVLRPAHERDVAAMVAFCRAHGIKVATRGQHHSMAGQGLVGCGLLIESKYLSRVHSIDRESILVDAGMTWTEVLKATLPKGLRPSGLTGYIGLSVGGVLSVGGCPMTSHGGGMVDRVSALEVVDGTGKIHACSDQKEPKLFEAMLGGLGQCGVITKARIRLVPAHPMARLFLLHYVDHEMFFRDLHVLLDRGELDDCYMVGMPPTSSAFTYELNAAKFFDPAHPPDNDFLLRGLEHPAALAVARDMSYFDYASYVDGQVAALQAVVGWDSLIKPWFDAWLPDDAVEGYVGDIVSELTMRDLGSGGFVLLFAQERSKMRRPFFRVPGHGKYVWLFDVATTSQVGVPDPTFVADMTARNRRWFNQALAVGGTRYPIGLLDFTHDDWARHFGDRWPAFQAAKRRYDPANIMTPGPGIF